MPECPKCQKPIDQLNHYENRRIGCSFTIQEDGKPQNYEWDEDFQLADPDIEYTCPECCELVCTTEEDAIKILRGEPIEPENIPCEVCGRKDLPLHPDYKCPECSQYGKEEK